VACRLALNVMSAALTAPIAGARVPTLSLSVTCSHGAPVIVLFVAALTAPIAGARVPTLSLSVTCSHGAPVIYSLVCRGIMAHMAGAYLPRDRSVTSCPKALHYMPASHGRCMLVALPRSLLGRAFMLIVCMP
jgi:hypothetical protein